MARVTVVPEQFTMVEFDAGEIARLAGEVADQVGLPGDFPINVEVDETNPFGHVVTELSRDAATIRVLSGSFEDAKRPAQVSEEGTRLVLGRVLFRVKDRLDPAFGDPPPDVALSYEQHTAWDTYALGRYERLGHDAQKPRRRYHFRVRHGFSDQVDRIFERLWASDGLTWADLEAAGAETAAARAPVEA